MRTRILDLECQDHGKVRSLSPEGYALVGWPGRRSRSVALHRKVYAEMNNISLDDLAGVVIRHTCDNTRCIEPTHLIPGTRGDNNRDRAERGRSAKLVPSRQTLSDQEVSDIRRLFKKSCRKFGGCALARHYGVDQSYIHRIIAGEERPCVPV